MLVRDRVSGEDLEAIIEPVTRKEFSIIRKSKDRFTRFNWDKYKEKEVYKLRLKNDETILGLICLQDHPEKDISAVEIEILEISDENIGSEKKLDGIGGCLIAFACKESFKRGRDGFVFLVPKTELLEHYHSKYGFDHIPLRITNRPEGIMVLHEGSSRKLIREYLEL